VCVSLSLRYNYVADSIIDVIHLLVPCSVVYTFIVLYRIVYSFVFKHVINYRSQDIRVILDPAYALFATLATHFLT